MNPLDTIKGTIIAGFVLAIALAFLNKVVTKSGATGTSTSVPAVKSK